MVLLLMVPLLPLLPLLLLLLLLPFAIAACYERRCLAVGRGIGASSRV